MKFRPSEIFFSQDSIANYWGKHTPFNDKLIGETLDELLTESISLKDIPIITAVKINGKFYTSDNRRLWVFRKAEELGFLDGIEINQITQPDFNWKKFTTKNDGISIRIRRDPGGKTWRSWKPNTFQGVNENTVSEFALNALENNANIFQDSLSNRTVADIYRQSKYKSSYSNNYSSKPSFRCDNDFLKTCESPVYDNNNHLSSTSKSNKEPTLCSNFVLESTLSKTSLRVQEPHANTMKTEDMSDTFRFKTGTLSESSSMYKSRYRDYNSSRPSYGSENIFSNHPFDSHVPNRNIELSRMGPISEEETTTCSESSFESALNKTSLLVQGPHAFKKRIEINQDAFCNRTVSDVYLPNILKSPHVKNHSSRPSFATDKTFKKHLESQVLKTGIQLSTIKSQSKEESTIHNKSSFESTLSKPLLPVHRPHPDTRRTEVINDSSCNKTFTEDERQSKDKSSYRKFVFGRPDFICDNAFTSNLESEVPDQEMKRSSIKTKSKEEATACNDSSHEITVSKYSLSVQRPHDYKSRNGVIYGSHYDRPVTEGECQSMLPEKNHPLSHTFVTNNDFTTNLKSQVPDEGFQFSKTKSKFEEETTICNKPFSESTLSKTSLLFQRPHNNASRTEFITDSSRNKTFTEDDRLSKTKSPYRKFLSARPNVVSDNTLANNLESQEPHQEIEFSRIERKPKGEATPRSASSFGLNLGKTSLAVQRPHVYTSNTGNIKDSTYNQINTEAERQSKDKSSYRKSFSARPNFLL
ncbi:uncharacterized protein LOC127705444 [Mytilus californianus]|uniref:uncharacterized protein LOC127705444 n=1 Tax=Mytilus californianus TaxID=6549 RepID=UPI0022475D68|nr:uncharacterized protein LOC127705444 [Mytilus californianus]